jgi:hypothetical protein
MRMAQTRVAKRICESKPKGGRRRRRATGPRLRWLEDEENDYRS